MQCVQGEGSEPLCRVMGKDLSVLAVALGVRHHGADSNRSTFIARRGLYACLFPFAVRERALKSHFTRQIWANSNQVLSAAPPVSFSFCHSNPQACMRARVAAGRLRGCRGGSCGGTGASAGAAGMAAAGWMFGAISAPAGLAGRGGGSGGVSGKSCFTAASSATAGQGGAG